ncbi:hypothetical protein J7413_08920 [Shimia sp. R10_1]|uniref:tetratricopeptide repeat protein n=1 Tax=Shimia sp. R10_1 TaxID=2821095 RepID=UPI001ADAB72D|nr:hypothetical protein [Shimia sp. R10_1]MBO9473656.1 hypothetical protein [Shimia sp. R10_1]
MLAMKAWQRFIALYTEAASKKESRRLLLTAGRKLAICEIKLRLLLIKAGELNPNSLWQEKCSLKLSLDGKTKKVLNASVSQTRKEYLFDFWNSQFSFCSDNGREALRRGYVSVAVKALEQEKLDEACASIQPLLSFWPDAGSSISLHEKLLLNGLILSPDGDLAELKEWWTAFDLVKSEISENSLQRIVDQSGAGACRLLAVGRDVEADWLIERFARLQPDHQRILRAQAELAVSKKDWREAVDYWQLAAAVSNPITTKSRTHVAKNAKEMARRSQYAKNQLRNARIGLAQELRDNGRRRESDELINRVLEMLPDHRIMKNDPNLLNLLRTYVQDALNEDGALESRSSSAGTRRIAICLDVFKISEIHTHSRVVYAVSRNLLELDPNLEIHLIITNERLAVTTPALNSSFNPANIERMMDRAVNAMPEFIGKRFFQHVFRNSGLEGVVSTCKSIFEINPEVILYGGGHRGLFSNESRVIRHCLFDYFPTAFFYIQANNQVDEKTDLIIARGPHAIEGNIGNAIVRVQPYPTIDKSAQLDEVLIDPIKFDNKIIVSAIAGVRMDVHIQKMDRDEMKEMFSILDRVPGAVWHIIGASKPDLIAKTNPEISQRIYKGQIVLHPLLPFEEFTDLVSNASLFFHMPGLTGGSGGASVARRSGVPVVTFEHSDVSGRQPPETVFSDEELSKAVDLSFNLLSDLACWEETVNAQFAHTQWIRDTATSGFYDCIFETAERYLKRSSVRSSPQSPMLAEGL